MSGLRLSTESYESLCDLLADPDGFERCAIGFANHDNVNSRWLLSHVEPVSDDGYLQRDQVSVSLKPAVLVDIVNRARQSGMTPVLVHSHPQTLDFPDFSPVDDAGEAEMRSYFERRIPQMRPLSMIVAPGGCAAREIGSGSSVPVWQVGTKTHRIDEPPPGVASSLRHERQIRAFGTTGQKVISTLKILVIGAGGTGSVTVQQLAYLGATDITVIDPDNVEETNLNRLVGAGPDDIGKAKVEIARRAIHRVNPEAKVNAIVGDIVVETNADMIRSFDYVFLCTDSHASRAVAGQAAYQFLVPTIDMGVSITVSEGTITHITGRVQMLSPGLPCLTCTGALNGEQIRQEMLTPEQRTADPYVQGQREPQPAVVSLNSTMASLGLTMFMGSVTDVPAQARFQLYDGVRGTIRNATASRNETCIVCSAGGSLAKGLRWPLPTRKATRDD
jgi:molybdopterin-synthase adenylyltransferase